MAARHDMTWFVRENEADHRLFGVPFRHLRGRNGARVTHLEMLLRSAV
jgi:hypothetical protein